MTEVEKEIRGIMDERDAIISGIRDEYIIKIRRLELINELNKAVNSFNSMPTGTEETDTIYFDEKKGEFSIRFKDKEIKENDTAQN